MLTNPDMLHPGILPHHPRWAKLFENLRYVVIDELHTYRGVFGSHLANVLRRLRRVCRHYGSRRQFICSSATIANPRELAERLIEEPVELVDENGAPRGEKFFVFCNPPVVNRQLGIRRSYLPETRRVAVEFLRRGLQTIVFAQSRLATEILHDVPEGRLRHGRRGAGRDPRLPRRVPAAGAAARSSGGCATGTSARWWRPTRSSWAIDIGALDVVGDGGLPGHDRLHLAARRPRGPAAGPSAAVLVASSAPLDQYIVAHPDVLLRPSPEHALINPDNLQILLNHLKCAAFELPVRRRREVRRRADVQQVLAVPGGSAVRAPRGGARPWHWTSESYPADAVSLRSVSTDNFVVVDDDRSGARVIGETDFTSALSTLHEKAIYLLEGDAVPGGAVRLRGAQGVTCAKVDCDYYTDAIDYTQVKVLDEFDAADGGAGRSAAVARRGARRLAGRRLQEDQVLHQRERRLRQARPARAGDAHDGVLADVPRAVMAALPYAPDDRRDGVVGLSFAMRQVAQLLLMCDRHDIGISIGSGERMPAPGRTGAPARAGQTRSTTTSRESSSTTTTPAASGSASRCTGCTGTCWRGRAS